MKIGFLESLRLLTFFTGIMKIKDNCQEQGMIQTPSDKNNVEYN